jgi:hypothetical protein
MPVRGLSHRVNIMCWLEQHKDALLVIAALASPFAAVFAALIASKR